MRGRSRALIAPFEEPTVNLTPLIDVVFVILIMFIVVAPLLDIDLIELASGPDQSQTTPLSVQEASAISIQVKADNSILLNNQVIPLAQLQERLAQEKKRFPTAKPQLFHDRKAHFGTYQAVKNAVEGAGFAEMEVVLNPG